MVAGGHQRRVTIPKRPKNNVNLWSVIKNSIGKDLNKIPMPINFNEPLSMLQRLAEWFEYSYLLDDAAKCDSVSEQLLHLAAFFVSNYSSTSQRTGKPFNPLLGETYECDRRTDFGWRYMAEQVSHHPPIAAVHCESDEWLCYQDFRTISSFRGQQIQVESPGYGYIEFKDSHNLYRYRKVIIYWPGGKEKKKFTSR